MGKGEEAMWRVVQLGERPMGKWAVQVEVRDKLTEGKRGSPKVRAARVMSTNIQGIGFLL
jgi:hypothetical protein